MAIIDTKYVLQGTAHDVHPKSRLDFTSNIPNNPGGRALICQQISNTLYLYSPIVVCISTIDCDHVSGGNGQPAIMSSAWKQEDEESGH